MAIIPTLPTSQSADSFTHQLLALSLPASADSLQIADACAAFVSVLVETDDAETRRALCGRLLDALGQLHALCDSDLSPYLVKHLLEGEKIDSCAPDCWQNTATQVEYAQALVQAIQGGNTFCKRREIVNRIAARYGLAAGGVCKRVVCHAGGLIATPAFNQRCRNSAHVCSRISAQVSLKGFRD
ncbi:Uncharacterised protein [Lelliottia amnigena]|nr:Uncharacterised protein [Lelliottia amnigena]